MSPTDHSFRRGVAAGLLGTAAYTAISHLIKKRLSQLAESTRPADVAVTLVGASVGARPGAFGPADDLGPADGFTAADGFDPGRPDPSTLDSRLLNAALHWGYGAAGGAARVLLERGGLSGWRLETAHFAAIWLPWRALVLAKDFKHRADRPATGGTGPRAALAPLALDVAKHAVYVYATGRALRLLGARRG